MTSYVILRKPYTYLEPVVRAMFAEAEDVVILVDRRWHERRQGPANGGTEDRRSAGDRRLSTPMLDILIADLPPVSWTPKCTLEQARSHSRCPLHRSRWKTTTLTVLGLATSSPLKRRTSR